jgi:predicted O-methyltransferase YrrM
MSKGEDFRPRFTFEISEEQQARANKLLTTFGLRRAVMSVILDDLLDLVEKHGQIVVGVMLDGAAKPREILPTMAKAERKAKDGTD